MIYLSCSKNSEYTEAVKWGFLGFQFGLLGLHLFCGLRMLHHMGLSIRQFCRGERPKTPAGRGYDLVPQDVQVLERCVIGDDMVGEEIWAQTEKPSPPPGTFS